MFKILTQKSFLARFFRLLGTVLVLSSGYFVYLDSTQIYNTATILHYENNVPVVRYTATNNQHITYKLEQKISETKHPVGSDLQVRYPRNEFDKTEYVSPIMQWAFYIALFIGLIIFVVGAIFTLQVRKQNLKGKKK